MVIKDRLISGLLRRDSDVWTSWQLLECHLSQAGLCWVVQVPSTPLQDSQGGRYHCPCFMCEEMEMRPHACAPRTSIYVPGDREIFTPQMMRKQCMPLDLRGEWGRRKKGLWISHGGEPRLRAQSSSPPVLSGDTALPFLEGWQSAYSPLLFQILWMQKGDQLKPFPLLLL